MDSMIKFDYCDHCGPSTRAYFYFGMAAGPLSFCGSCGTRYEDAIVAQGGKITHDFRYLITA